jgi:hypothetical protein
MTDDLSHAMLAESGALWVGSVEAHAVCWILPASRAGKGRTCPACIVVGIQASLPRQTQRQWRRMQTGRSAGAVASRADRITRALGAWRGSLREIHPRGRSISPLDVEEAFTRLHDEAWGRDRT